VGCIGEDSSGMRQQARSRDDLPESQTNCNGASWSNRVTTTVYGRSLNGQVFNDREPRSAFIGPQETDLGEPASMLLTIRSNTSMYCDRQPMLRNLRIGALRCQFTIRRWFTFGHAFCACPGLSSMCGIRGGYSGSGAAPCYAGMCLSAST